MRAFLLKLQPNQDVTEALEAAILDVGLAKARIVAAVGSLVDATLETANGVTVLNGPGLEVAALSGDIIASGGSNLHGFVCQTNTGAVEGDFIRSQNAVGVTFELLISEC